MILLKINQSSPTFEITDVKANLIMLLNAFQFKYKLSDTKAMNRSLFVLIGFQKKIRRYILNLTIKLDNIINIGEYI
jgi:hypothetical protein